MKNKSTRKKASSGSEPSEQSLLGSVAHTLGDAVAEAVGAAADTVTEFVKEELPLKKELARKKKPHKRTRPNVKAKAKAKPRNRAALKAVNRATRAGAKPKRKTARPAKKNRRPK